MSHLTLPALLFATALLAACRGSGEADSTAQAARAQEAAASPAQAQARAIESGPAERRDVPPAEVGQPAPDFELYDLDGRRVRLADFAGRPVVLEWFNPHCPYVVTAHRDGELADCAREQEEQGVVWLAINSTPDSKPGGSLEQNRAAREEFAMNCPLLLDPSGRVGKLYQARCTPQLFVIDAQGLLVYSGAIDNAEESPRAEAINYVERALLEMKSGQVSIPRTRPYGSFVDYVD